MMTPLLYTLIGCMAGTVAGIIPGTGLLVTLLILYPMLIQLDLISLLCFYIGLANVAQFTGSVTSIYFGIPGESNSVPAVIEGHRLSRQGQGHSAIVGTGLGSLLAGTTSIFVLMALSGYYNSIISWFYSINNQFILFVTVFIFFIILTSNRWYTNIFIMGFGYLISRIGFNDWTGEYFLSFDNLSLGTGIPFFPVVLGILVVPNLFKHYNFELADYTRERLSDCVVKFFKNIQYSFFGTFIGMVCGLVPAVSTVLATNVAHKIVRWYEKYPNNIPSYRALISAESANNSAILVTLLPLIVLGIPITGSEALLVSILERNVIDLNWQVIVDNDYHIMLFASVLMSLCIGIIVSWPLSTMLQRIIMFAKDYFSIVIAIILVCCLMYVGHTVNDIAYYLLVFVVFSVVGWICRNINMIPFIFVFLVQEQVESVMIVVYNMYI